MKPRRAVIGFVHRTAYATLIGFITWFLWTARFDMLPLGREVQVGIVKVLTFPVAIVSEQTPPTGWKALDPFTRDAVGHNEPNEKLLLWHLRLAVPVYVILFYIPNVISWIVRRARHKGRDRAAGAATRVEET